MEESTSKLTKAISEPIAALEDGLKKINLSIPLKKAKSVKRVEWSRDTVDNEHLGHRSSKCCSVYEKPHVFDESSSESEREDEDNCHVLCAWGHEKGRRCPVHSSDIASASSPKPQGPSEESLLSSIKE
ncbi:E3 ubiquitin-protein ligase PPP1R11-like [Acomys russatus]|uniref:E3 ubiquitin-protein ligase PPP1R11-like n=1 Tax=Acomys russatus TaxID=60746 RepID=UPI0021E278A3|nr:E3 ubiquitin-protein ligase PPP1R11-like [Acomys russatus]